MHSPASRISLAVVGSWPFDSVLPINAAPATWMMVQTISLVMKIHKMSFGLSKTPPWPKSSSATLAQRTSLDRQT